MNKKNKRRYVSRSELVFKQVEKFSKTVSLKKGIRSKELRELKAFKYNSKQKDKSMINISAKIYFLTSKGKQYVGFDKVKRNQ